MLCIDYFYAFLTNKVSYALNTLMLMPINCVLLFYSIEISIFNNFKKCN